MQMPLQPLKNGAGPHMQGPAGAHAGPPSHVQFPAVQPLATSESHALPQLPQWLVLVCVFTHDPVQQLSLPAQVRPHAPQFPTFV